jgi:predicted aspartyl protease
MISGFAAAAECGSLTRVAQFAYVPDAWGRPLVPVTLNGRRKLLLVDTGGFNSTLERATVRELGLRTIPVNMGVTTVTGASSNDVVSVAEFLMGGARFRDHYFWIDPDGDPSRIIGEHEMAGLVGAEVLRNYDLELDARGGTVNLFRQDHCPGAVVHWQAERVAVIPFTLGRSLHITLPVILDGREVEAILDTGAADTVLNLSVALGDFAIDLDAPDVQRINQMQRAQREGDRRDPVAEAVYRRRFKVLEVGGLTVTNPMITLLPDLTGNDGGLPDLILGLSTLSKLHLYIAYRERKLYVTPTGSSAAVMPAPQ